MLESNKIEEASLHSFLFIILFLVGYSKHNKYRGFKFRKVKLVTEKLKKMT